MYRWPTGMYGVHLYVGLGTRNHQSGLLPSDIIFSGFSSPPLGRLGCSSTCAPIMHVCRSARCGRPILLHTCSVRESRPLTLPPSSKRTAPFFSLNWRRAACPSRVAFHVCRGYDFSKVDSTRVCVKPPPLPQVPTQHAVDARGGPHVSWHTP